MATPQRRTVDGFELQPAPTTSATSALTGLLFLQLAKADAARVVTVASQAHRMARSVPLTDPRHDQRRYRKWTAYAESKLANLLFAFELDRRSRAAGTNVASMAAHPVRRHQPLLEPQPGRDEGRRRHRRRRLPPARSALGHGRAALADGGDHAGTAREETVGPRGPRGTRRPTLVMRHTARDEVLAGKLWEVSEEATRIHF